MWNDIDTDDDLLNFNVVADTATNIIFESKDQPVSIGISGIWGTGKSSMLRIIRKSISLQDKDKQYICLQFDAWRYQGYEDAKSALLQQVGNKLLDYAKIHETFRDKINDFVAKIDWFKTIKYLGGAAGCNSRSSNRKFFNCICFKFVDNNGTKSCCLFFLIKITSMV